ncbi:MAG: prepilin-type N-terminal cleavage/methylation domain-containing protein [Patescibacteria group bacterium]
MNKTSHIKCSNAQKKQIPSLVSGFTLIELMVVIALIGILASVILASFSSVRERNRDSKRLSDVREIQKALSLYQIDNGRFPAPTNPTEIVTITGEDEISLALEEGGHISAVPKDPQHDTLSYTYQADENGYDFTITFCLETNTIRSFEQGCGNSIKP